MSMARGITPMSEDSDGNGQMALQAYVQKKINLRARPGMTLAQQCLAVFAYGQLLVQVAACLWVFASRNVDYTSEVCYDGHQVTGLIEDICISNDLYTKRAACRASQDKSDKSSDRAIQWTIQDWSVTHEGGTGKWDVADDDETGEHHKEKSHFKDKSMARMLVDNMPILAPILPMIVLLCFVWLFALARATAFVVWGNLALNVGLMCYLAYLFDNWMILLVAAIVLIVWFFFRLTAVRLGIEALQLAGTALEEKPETFAVSALFAGAYLTYGACFIYTATQTARAVDISSECEMTSLSRASWFFLTFGQLLFIFSTCFFRNCVLSVCSLSVACWYFPEAAAEEGVPPTNPAALGARLALTSSSGCVAAASLVEGLVEYARRRGNSTCCGVPCAGLPVWLCDPVGCLVHVLWCCLESALGSVTHFALIGHVLHGDDLEKVGLATFKTLKTHLPGVVMTNFISESIMSDLYLANGTAVGLYVLYALDQREELGIFHMVAEWRDPGQSSVQFFSAVVVLAVLLYTVFVRNPLVSIVLLTCAYSYWEFTNATLNALAISVFSASITALVFRFFGRVVEYAADTIFFCFAMEAEGGEHQARMVKLYDMMENHILKEPMASSNDESSDEEQASPHTRH